MDKKSGKSADINLFLIGILQGAGLKSYPVILSTRNNGKIVSDYPFDHYYNYVIAYTDLGNGRILSDATTPLLGFNELPVRCINDKGMLIKEKEHEWVSIYNHVSSYDKSIFEIELSEDLSKTKVTILKSLNGMSAYSYKTKYDDKETKLRRYFKNQGLENVKEIRTKDYEKTDKPYFITAEAEGTVDQLMNKIVIRPFYNFPISRNPFTEEKRSYDIDLVYTTNTVFESKVKIPKGYKVLELPKTMTINNDLIKLNCTSKIEGDQAVFNYSYTLKKSKYSPKDYSEIKRTFAILVSKFNPQLVLEPVEN